MDDEVIVGDVLDLDAESTHAIDRGLRVAGAAEAVDLRLPLAEPADQDGAVRDRLVAGHDHVPHERSSRFDPHPMVRPIRDASARISSAKSPNSEVGICCAASHNASSGRG